MYEVFGIFYNHLLVSICKHDFQNVNKLIGVITRLHIMLVIDTYHVIKVWDDSTCAYHMFYFISPSFSIGREQQLCTLVLITFGKYIHPIPRTQTPHKTLNKLILFNDANQLFFFGFCGRGKTEKNNLWVTFFWQFCDVPKVAIIHRRI